MSNPVFTLRLLWKRIGWFIFRRFIGNSIRSPVTGELIFNGQSMTSYWAFHSIKELGTNWEHHIRNAAAPVVYDVGSNLGHFRRLVMSLNPGAVVTTIDAWKEMSAYVPVENHLSVGVGSDFGTAHLYKEGLNASTNHGVGGGVPSLVQIRTLDDIWDCKPVDLLKMDIEGAEHNALLGAQKMIEHVKIIIVETSTIDTIKLLCPGREWSTVNGFDWVGIKTALSQYQGSQSSSPSKALNS